ncbi:hypothetical protein BDV10DRAFT_201111 [Aspergillus recurvatus]
MEVDVDTWVDHEYPAHRYIYKQLAQKVEKICGQALNKENIQHVIFYRIKDPESLRAKLKKQRNSVWTADKISKHVFDIAGVQIALYRPDQEQRVRDIIENKCGFIINKIDTNAYPPPLFGKKDRSSTYELTKPRYKATHWIVKLGPDDQETLKAYPVEIQVTSLLRRSWAQIQHDYTYKPVSGDLSSAEINTLEAFGRVVELGESFLYQLSSVREERQEERRKPFANIYDLGSFLARWYAETYSEELNDLGPLKALMDLLEKTGMNNQEQFGMFLDALHPNLSKSLESTRQHFGDLELRPTVFVIHHLVAEHQQQLIAPKQEWWDGHREGRSYKSKLKIIMSAILWFFDFFPATNWEIPFSRARPSNDHERVKRLYWLSSWEPNELLAPANESFDAEHCENIDALWGWFKNNDSPALRLTFVISKAEILRDVGDRVELCLFNRLFSTLGQALENEFKEIKQGEDT